MRKPLFVMAVIGGALCWMPVPVQASSWFVCEGQATVESSAEGQDGQWVLQVTSAQAMLLDGMVGRKGDPCPAELDRFSMTAGRDIPAGETVRFQYSLYTGMGPQGAVLNRSWTLVE